MNNPPAFPVFPETGAGHAAAFQGMTLRDYFAAHAMSSLMPAVINEIKKTRGTTTEAIRLQSLSAQTCYSMADAMLAAREDT
jgi:hypothetical protein